MIKRDYPDKSAATNPRRPMCWIAALLLVMVASCVDTADPEQADASTPGQADASTPGQADASTPEQADASTPGQADASTPGPADASIPEDASPMSDYITITQIEILNETDGFGLLEIEVHMVDASNGVLIGCSGDYNGLANVDEQGVLYSALTAHFVSPDAPATGDAPPEMWITLADVQNKNIRLIVIEDDSGPCPAPIGDFDDHIATSNAFSGSALATLSTMSFGDVPVITLGRHP